MSKIVQWSQYEQISTTNLNNMSKYMIEYVLKDILRYCVSNQKCVVFGETTIVEQNTGTDYNVKVNPHFAINIEGNPFIRTALTTLSFGVPTVSARVDIIQAAMGYSNANAQSRQFIDPATGSISSLSTYIEFQLDSTVSVKQGTEGTGLAPAVDSGQVKIAEVYVDTAGGIADADIFNVNSLYGENNTGWTYEQAVTTYLTNIQDHKIATTLDHPDSSVTLTKIHGDALRNIRSFSTPSITIDNGDDIIIHEITVPAGKTLTILNMGISIQNDGTPDSNLTIQAGSYSGGFTPLLSSYVRNTDYSTSNTFAATTVVQIRIYNATGSSQDATGHFVYTIS